MFVVAATNAIAVEAPSNFIVLDAPRPLPDIAIADGGGKIGALADFRGKFVLLNIWATWCVPCRKEMPTLDRLQGQLGGPDFEVVALSIDRGGAETVRKFYAEVGIQHLAVRFDAAAEAPFKLAAVGLPTTVLIDPKGQEIGRVIGPAKWDSPEMIDSLKATITQKDSRPSPTPTPNQEN
jgi:thiol-disulfide isomerase/thioredoxin